MTEAKDAHKGIEKALDAYVDATNNVGAFVTGWFLVASLSSTAHDEGNQDAYVSLSSDGLPHHAQIGLLTVALDDKKNMTMIGALREMMYEDDDDDEEED